MKCARELPHSIIMFLRMKILQFIIGMFSLKIGLSQTPSMVKI